ncbi:hypothetical protein, partial [uncultured Duncaniella sp.]
NTVKSAFEPYFIALFEFYRTAINYFAIFEDGKTLELQSVYRHAVNDVASDLCGNIFLTVVG